MTMAGAAADELAGSAAANPETWQALAELESTRRDTQALAAPLTQPQLDARPGAGSWTVGEILDHLVRANAMYRGNLARLIDLARAGRRPYIQQTLSDLNVGPALLPRVMMPLLDVPFAIMSAVLPDAVRDVMTTLPLLRLRSPEALMPRAGRPRAELVRDLDDSMAETRRLLEANRAFDFGLMVSHHPLTGASNVPRLLHFAALHERRHQQQMRDAIAVRLRASRWSRT